MLNLNPDLVDQDKLRKAKRKRLLRYVMGPCLLLIFCGGFLLRTGIFNIAYNMSFASRNYDIDKSLASFQLIGNVAEPFVAYYNRGAAELADSSFKEAEQDFRASLKNNPPEIVICKLYLNLAISIEAQGDVLKSNNNFDEALLSYNRAKAIISDSNCALKKGSEYIEDANSAIASIERITQKHNAAVKSLEIIEGETGDKISETRHLNEDQKGELKRLRDYSATRSLDLYYSIGDNDYTADCNNSNNTAICW